MHSSQCILVKCTCRHLFRMVNSHFQFAKTQSVSKYTFMLTPVVKLKRVRFNMRRGCALNKLLYIVFYHI